jgi:Phosphotransferase enzyme family
VLGRRAFVNLRRVDLRLVLPRSPTRAVVLGDLEAWRAGLALAGVEVVQETRAAPDLAVAPVELAAEATSSGAEAVILEGRGGDRRLVRAGLSAQRFLPLPTLGNPDLVLPLTWGAGSRYALARWRPADTPVKQVRNRSVALLLELGVFPRIRPEQAVGLRSPAPPFPIAAAASLGVPSDTTWFMTLGQGDPLTRVAFHLFPPGAMQPRWVLKLARVAGLAEPFERDEAGLRLAKEAAGSVVGHAPSLVGRFEAEGLPASLETAAIGERLSTLLARRPRPALAAVDEIAAWILRVGHETALPPAALGDERRRLVEHVLPPWRRRGAPADLVARLPELPAVLQHNDLGSWNLVVRPGGGFVALDWEGARRNGLPLWDLLYFLVDALPLLEGALTPEHRATSALRVLRGESPLSETLFSWLRRGAAAAGVPRDAVGRVVTLCLLHHGLSHLPRRAAAEVVESGSAAVLSPIDRLAPLWLADPALGPEWPAWCSSAPAGTDGVW